MGTFMTASEFFTRTPRHSLGDSARRLVRRPALLGALVALVVLASCGKSTQTANPAPKSIGSTSGSTSGGTTVQAGQAGQADGQPAAQFAFATSDLDLIKSTSGTNGWVTILAAQLKTPASKEVSLSASLEAGLYTQTLVSSKNLKKDTP